MSDPDSKLEAQVGLLKMENDYLTKKISEMQSVNRALLKSNADMRQLVNTFRHHAESWIKLKEKTKDMQGMPGVQTLRRVIKEVEDGNAD